MNKIAILVICRHPQILSTILRLIHNNPDWQAIGVITDDEAVEAFTAQHFDLVLLGNGISDAAENKLKATFTQHNPATVVIQHYGGGSGLLSAEIYGALSQRQG